MSNLEETARSLYKEGKVKLIIGFEEGTGHPRPFFCTSADDIPKLILDKRCHNNTAVYLTRKEVRDEGPVGIVATPNVLRSVLQLGRENQIYEGEFLFIAGEYASDVQVLEDKTAIQDYADAHPAESNPKDEEMLHRIGSMSREDRWTFWKDELSKCIRCYACRAACPLCYCERCIVEVNCPQWIDPWAAPLSNMEWQINRVMHMAGRCTGCGACYEACPLDLPIHLLTRELTSEVTEDFGKDTSGNVLSTFNLADKGNFFK
jgi:ferredoxin